MNGFLNVNCGVDQGNVFTRIGMCAAFEGTPKALIFHPVDESYVATDDGAFTTAIDADLAAAKAFAITTGIVNVEPSGGETRVQQEGFGASKANGWEPYSEVYTVNAGGLCLLKQLIKVDGKDYRVLIVDDKDVVYGEAVEGGEAIRGFAVSLGVARRRNTGTEGGAIRVSLFYSLGYFKQMTRLAAVAYAGEDIVTVTGIQLMNGSATGKFHLVDACSGEKLDAATLATIVPATNLEGYQVQADGSVVTKAVTYTSGDEITLTGAVAGLKTGIKVKNPGTALGTDPLFFGIEDATVIAK